MTFAQIQARLEEIDADLLTRTPKLERAAKDYFTVKRDYERAKSEAYLKTTGTVGEREAATVLALWKADAYKSLVVAEADYEAQKAVIRVLETRASIGQSLLRVQRETGG